MHVYAVYVSDQCKCLLQLTRRVELELVVALVRSSVHLEESYSLSLAIVNYRPQSESHVGSIRSGQHCPCIRPHLDLGLWAGLYRMPLGFDSLPLSLDTDSL